MPVNEARKQAKGAQDLVPLAQLLAVQAPSRCGIWFAPHRGWYKGKGHSFGISLEQIKEEDEACQGFGGGVQENQAYGLCHARCQDCWDMADNSPNLSFPGLNPQQPLIWRTSQRFEQIYKHIIGWKSIYVIYGLLCRLFVHGLMSWHTNLVWRYVLTPLQVYCFSRNK